MAVLLCKVCGYYSEDSHGTLSWQTFSSFVVTMYGHGGYSGFVMLID